jgi:hypothetical protein
MGEGTGRCRTICGHQNHLPSSTAIDERCFRSLRENAVDQRSGALDVGHRCVLRILGPAARSALDARTHGRQCQRRDQCGYLVVGPHRLPTGDDVGQVVLKPLQIGQECRQQASSLLAERCRSAAQATRVVGLSITEYSVASPATTRLGSPCTLTGISPASVIRCIRRGCFP